MQKNNDATLYDNNETIHLYNNAIQFIIDQHRKKSGQEYYHKDIAQQINEDPGKLSKLKTLVNAENAADEQKTYFVQRQALLEKMIAKFMLKIIYSLSIENDDNVQTFKIQLNDLKRYLPRLNDQELAQLLFDLVGHTIALETKKRNQKVSQKSIAQSIVVNPSQLSRLKKLSSSKGRYVGHERRNCIEIIERIAERYSIYIYCSITVDYCSPDETFDLHMLAHKLAINLIDVSMPFKEKVNPQKEIIREGQEIELFKDQDRKKERFILVAGAGASYAATNKYIPLGKEAAEEIRKRLLEKPIPETLIKEEIDRLSFIYRLPPDEFETKILAYSKYGRKEVIEALREICGYAYIPSLSYEIIAHMFKHRFIDGIINFNYDEVLDVAVREELQKGDFKFIYSDAHCPGSYHELLINDRLRQPVYIKPHGTISHRSSLRFTREDFFSIPPEIRNTMKDLIEAAVIEQNQQQPYLNLNLILVGYSLTNFEFIKLIQEYLETRERADLTIWVFDTNLHLDEVEKEFQKEQWARIEIKYFDLGHYKLEDYMLALWKLIEGNFKDHYKPRGIERHQLVNHIFNFSADQLKSLGRGENAQKKSNQSKYFLGRFYVELIIAYLQSDGILNAKQILEDRAGDYFHLYLESGGTDTSLREHCERLGLKVYKDFLWDTYILEKPALFYEKKELFDFLLEKLQKHIPPRYQNTLLGKENANHFHELCRMIRQRNIAKITPNFVFPHNHLFSSIKKEDILNTTIGWIYRFQEAVRKEDEWDLMLSISEKGRFLKKSVKEGLLNSGKKIELVLASFDTDELQDLRNDDLTLEQYTLTGSLNFLPWWLHNQHMVLLMKHTGKNTGDWTQDWKMFEGFYYESRLLSRRVNPIHIKDSQEDLQILLYIFANYWYRAKSYTESKKTSDSARVPIIPNKSTMEKIINKLLSEYPKTASTP